jgi:hypothetical protein
MNEFIKNILLGNIFLDSPSQFESKIKSAKLKDSELDMVIKNIQEHIIKIDKFLEIINNQKNSK